MVTLRREAMVNTDVMVMATTSSSNKRQGCPRVTQGASTTQENHTRRLKLLYMMPTTAAIYEVQGVVLIE